MQISKSDLVTQAHLGKRNVLKRDLSHTKGDDNICLRLGRKQTQKCLIFTFNYTDILELTTQLRVLGAVSDKNP